MHFIRKYNHVKHLFAFDSITTVLLVQIDDLHKIWTKSYNPLIGNMGRKMAGGVSRINWGGG